MNTHDVNAHSVVNSTSIPAGSAQLPTADGGILFVLIGPTAVGKTEVSLRLAEHLGCPIISADSRQMFRDIPIGTAAPTADEQSRVEHFFVGTLSLDDYYSASRYEAEALEVIGQNMERYSGRMLLSGGSMMYVDAVCNGIDEMPDIRDDIRMALKTQYAAQGLAPLVEELRRLDPEYASQCDLQNHVRVIHALEICRQTGKTYSSFRTRNNIKEQGGVAGAAADAAGAGSAVSAVRFVGGISMRPFRIVKIGLDRPREELFERINRRTTLMVEQGFIDEARRVLPWRSCNSLNTVGYKEIFRYFDGEWPLDVALDRIRKNTRVYAKKQLTWFKRDASIRWFHPDDLGAIFAYVDAALQQQ